MWKARGSIPRISNFCPVSNRAVVAEWLRRWTWNPMGSARVGSNPANCDKFFTSTKIASCGVWTHGPQFTRLVLYHWAKEASCQRSYAPLFGQIMARWYDLQFRCVRSRVQFPDEPDFFCLEKLISPFSCATIEVLGANSSMARLAEWSKAWDLSSHNRKIAWVQTPHLAEEVFGLVAKIGTSFQLAPVAQSVSARYL